MKFVRLGSSLLAAALLVSCSTLETADERALRIQTADPGGLAFDQPIPTVAAELRLALVRPESWDPTQLSLADQDAVIVADLLFDGLTEATADGRLVPGLATSWSATEDQYAWTFALDTTRTSAVDVKLSFERLLADAPDSPAAALLASVVRIEILDAATIRFVHSAPSAGFAWLLSGLPYSISDDSGSTTGRFEVIEETDTSAVLRSGEGDDAQTILIDWVADHETAQAAAESGAVDGAVVPLDQTERAAGTVGAPIVARNIVRFYGMAPTSETFADDRVRRAVLAAIDTRTLIEESSTPALVASGLVAPTTIGFGADSCGTICDFDLEVVAGILAEIGPVPAIRVGFTGDHERSLADGVVGQLAAAGLDAEPVEIADGGLATALAAGNVDLFPFGWVAPAGSIDAVVPALLGAGSPANPIGSISAEVDETLTAAASTSDDVSRWALLETAHRQALGAASFVPVSVAENRLAVSSAFTGVLIRADGSLEIRTLP